jgi:CheY-like chemotaxis protein
MQSLRILVVDDLRDAADSLALLMQLWGHETVIAYDGADAVHVAATKLPDVVLLDIGLPSLDGYEVARRLRQMPGMGKALLVAITGYGRAEDVRRCKDAGIDYHFQKPVNPSQLQEVLTQTQV